ncbi:MAG: Mrp/NBP35 family ATP-binding protein, partial [Pirellulaceae bacterium]|nr:Mrp/NBP35 family ATP-binding protein [Pirellulaceae bacterium]
PGTGDVALSLSQLLPLTGAVVVCTPQEVALLDALKAISMFQKVKIPLLGMIENMSGFVSPESGKQFDIFGSGGTQKAAEELQVPFLGKVPIEIDLRTLGDRGQMAKLYENEPLSRPFTKVCYQLSKQLALSAVASPQKPQLPVL